MAIGLVLYLAILLPGDPAFLSDDYSLSMFHDSATGALNWSKVFESLAEPWYGTPDYWRPMATLSAAINVSVLGFSPLSMQVLNLSLHLGIVAATAELCYRFGGASHPCKSGVIGGLFVAMHPFAMSPVLWIAAQSTGL